jgi:hypothetical protein
MAHSRHPYDAVCQPDFDACIDSPNAALLETYTPATYIGYNVFINIEKFLQIEMLQLN